MPLIRLLAVCGLAASAVLSAAEEAKWYKGNLHTHTYWSDGDDFPEMVADWYKSQVTISWRCRTTTSSPITISG
jgi:23S rRNA G2069 N7-methylase RlmK/C1962 C5-methylase RlmI